MRRLSLIILLTLLLTSTALAERLRIVDQKGLTRAVRSIDKPASVVVSLKNAAESVSLIQTNGVAAEIPGQAVGKNTVQFNNVSPGTWKLSWTGKTKVLNVEIR